MDIESDKQNENIYLTNNRNSSDISKNIEAIATDLEQKNEVDNSDKLKDIISQLNNIIAENNKLSEKLLNDNKENQNNNTNSKLNANEINNNNNYNYKIITYENGDK